MTEHDGQDPEEPTPSGERPNGQNLSLPESEPQNRFQSQSVARRHRDEKLFSQPTQLERRSSGCAVPALVTSVAIVGLMIYFVVGLCSY